MKRKLIFIFSFIPLLGLYSQVGINNTDPKTTLHITPTKTDNTTAEGIIAPNLTRAQLIDKDIRYTVLQKGAIVYVTAIDGVVTTKTTKITATGYYYFDGSVWQPFGGGGGAVTIPPEPWRVQGGITEATSNSENIYQQGNVAIGAGLIPTSIPKDKTLYVNGITLMTGITQVGVSNKRTFFRLHGDMDLYGRAIIDSTLRVKKMVTINSTGGFKLEGNNAGAGKFLMSDANGKATWTALPATATNAEPWRVQGGSAQATDNTQHIYQTGKVAIGAAQATAEVAETLLVDGSTRLKGAAVVDNLLSVGSTSLPTNYIMQISGNGKGSGGDYNFGGLHVMGRTRMDEGLGIGTAPPPTGIGMMLDVIGIDGNTAVYVRKGDIESKGKVLAEKGIETNDILYAKGGYIGLGITFDLDEQKKNNKTAILQIASKKPATAGGATTGGTDPVASSRNNAGGGLGLSRANLGYSNSLQDFASELTGGAGGGTSDEKLNATGTVLYNLGTANKTSKGLNMWNGERWANLGNVPFFFYMPSINVDVSGATTTLKTLDLYSEYQKQFAGTRTPARISNPSAPKAIAIYDKNEIDYYVTDYDATAIKVVSVTDAGVLSYYPTGTATESSYINVVFVLK